MSKSCFVCLFFTQGGFSWICFFFVLDVWRLWELYLLLYDILVSDEKAQICTKSLVDNLKRWVPKHCVDER